MRARLPKRVVSAALSASLLLGAPGFSAYEAAAQVVRVPAGASVGAESAAAASAASAQPAGVVRFELGALSIQYQSAHNPFILPTAAVAPAAVAPAALAPAALAPAPAAVLRTPVAVPVRAAALPLSGPVRAAAPVFNAAAAASLPVSGPDAPAEKDSARASQTFDQAAPHPADESAVAEGAPSAPAPSGLAPAAGPAPARAKIPRPLWGFFWGHDITTVLGVNFHILSQPFLVQSTLGMGTAAMGFVRNIHMGSMALVNFLPIGYLIDKTDYRVVALSTTVLRALLMGSIPLLFSAGLLHFWVLAAIVALNPLFQSTMIVAEGAANKTILGKDEALNKDATATFGKWDALAGMLMPLVAGWGVGALVTAFGLGGYAMAYGVYAALLLASLPVYWFMVRDPRFPAHDALGAVEFARQSALFLGALVASMVHPFVLILRWAFSSFVPGARSAFPSSFGAAALWLAREAAITAAGLLLLVPALLKALFALPRALKSARAGSGLGAAGVADLLDGYKPMQGLAFILRNKILRVLTGVMALEVMLSDALPFVIIPNLITEAVGQAPSYLPGFLATAGGLMGVLFSVEYLGRFIPSMRLEGEKGDAIIEKVGHGRFYKRAALGTLLFWGLLAPLYLTTGLFWVNLAIVAGVMFTVQYFNTPVGIVLAPVKRAEMDDSMLARIESAMFMVDVAFESIGALAIGLMMDFLGLKAALIATCAFLTLTSVLQYKVPSWIFPDGNRPPKK